MTPPTCCSGTEADALVAAGHKAIGIQCDVADIDQVEAMIKETVATFGRLDAAFNNAGIQNQLVEIADATSEDYDNVMSVNLRGVWACMKFQLQQMRRQGNGAIVNCSSLGGLVGGAERANYHAAKHGVIGLTKSAAVEYAEEAIRVNAVCPGYIETKMTEDTMRRRGGRLMAMVPFGRMGQPEEIGEMVLFLCSDRSSYISGACYNVDGGYMAI